MSKYFDLLQENEREENLQTRLPAVPQLAAGDELLELDLPFIADTRALVVTPRPSFHPEPSRSLTFRSVVEGCFRYPYRFTAVAGGLLLLTALAIVLLPRQYQATMQMLAPGPAQYAAAGIDAGAVADSDLNTQASLLRSRDLLTQALDQSGTRFLSPQDHEKAIDTLIRRLRVTPLANSNTLRVSVTESSPEQAVRLLDAIAASFVSRQLALLRPSHQRLAEVADQSRQQLEKAQQELARFKQATGMGSSADYEAALMRQLDGYAADSTNLAEKLAVVRQRRAAPQQQALKSRLVMLEHRRNSLLDTFEPTDPVIDRVDQQIAGVRDRLVRGEADPSTSEGRAQLAERNSIDAQKRAYVAQLTQLQAQPDQLDRLQKQVTGARQAYDNAVYDRDNAAVADARDLPRVIDAVLATRPTASLTPVQPRPTLYAAVGVTLAILLAVGVCAYAEMTRNTICTPAELDGLTGVATLGTVPRQPSESAGMSRRQHHKS